MDGSVASPRRGPTNNNTYDWKTTHIGYTSKLNIPDATKKCICIKESRALHSDEIQTRRRTKTPKACWHIGLLQVLPLQTATGNTTLKRGCRSTCPVARAFLICGACATVIQDALLECAVPDLQKTAVDRCQDQPRVQQDGELRRQLGELLRATCRMVCIAYARCSRRAQKGASS